MMKAMAELPLLACSACQYITADSATEPALAFTTCMLNVCAPMGAAASVLTALQRSRKSCVRWTRGALCQRDIRTIRTPLQVDSKTSKVLV